MKNLIFIWICLILAIPCQGRTITVDDDGPADFSNIQAGINDASDGDTVIVAPGTYTGPGNRDIDFLGKAITVRSTDPNDLNVVAATIINCNGTPNEPHRGFYFHNDEDANSVLAGLTITNGYAPEEFLWDHGWFAVGGAIFCYDASPTIAKCTISRNEANAEDDPFSWGGGGGICCLGENLTMTITDCHINENTAISLGGGILCVPLDGYFVVTISNCTITKNSAWVGGGICSRDGTTTIITDCTIQGNSARWGGGIKADRPTITNSYIIANSAIEDGGGIDSGSCGSGPILDNCIISGNLAGEYGGGMHGAPQTMTNCTFSANSALNGNALASRAGYCLNALSTNRPQITNSILADGGDEIIGRITVTYSNVQGGYPGQGNIDVDPCFVNPGFWELTRDLISFWEFDEGSGATAYDSAGDNDGTVYGATWTTGKFDGALSFDGTDDYVNVSHSNGLNPGTWWSFTVCGWIKPGTWYLVVGVRDGESGKVQLYLNDGQKIGELTDNTGDINYGGDLQIGGRTGASEYYDGLLDNVIIYSRALSDYEIQQLYQNGLNRYDYHLKSSGWRWDSEQQEWDFDRVTSQCIDAGNPGSPLGEELLSVPDDPNNEWGENIRINMGAYGGTAEASMPPYDWSILADLTNDGAVDFVDFTCMAAVYTDQNDQPAGDLDRDNDVDMADICLLTEDWLKETSWHE
ncbi:MAG: LamG domain-containing protein, partial [Planctomycetota bacterium]